MRRRRPFPALNITRLSSAAAMLALGAASPSAVPNGGATDWASPVPPVASAASAQVPVDRNAPQRLPDSSRSFSRNELGNLFDARDWRPDTHPPMPPVVVNGRQPEVRACAYCHLPSGNGRPENAALAGLPRGYIVAQMEAFRSGARRSTFPDRAPQTVMTASAKASTDAEIAAAADYFAAIPRTSFTRVVERAQVPRTRTVAWLYSRDPAGGSEPIGARIIELPDDFARFELRDPGMRYLAYVPPGSIARGARLARDWGDGGNACASCHGPNYKGDGDIPPLAGRSPTYIVRQLTDFRNGARGGPAAEPMHAVVARMDNAQMIALAAYLGSRAP